MTLPPEQQLHILQEAVAPCVAHLGRWQHSLWLFPLATLLLVIGQGFWGALVALWACVGVAMTYRERRLWSTAQGQVATLAPAVRGTDAVAPLLDFARWQGKGAVECHEALERLLPRLDTTSARQLTAAQRGYLRLCVENQDPSVEFTVAALLVLASAGDPATVPIARQLAACSSSQRIRDAAQLVLEELEGHGIGA